MSGYIVQHSTLLINCQRSFCPTTHCPETSNSVSCQHGTNKQTSEQTHKWTKGRSRRHFITVKKKFWKYPWNRLIPEALTLTIFQLPFRNALFKKNFFFTVNVQRTSWFLWTFPVLVYQRELFNLFQILLSRFPVALTSGQNIFRNTIVRIISKLIWCRAAKPKSMALRQCGFRKQMRPSMWRRKKGVGKVVNMN